MLVKCPSCATAYNVSDDRMRGSAATFRCSRCKHVFELEVHPGSKGLALQASPAAPETDTELAFTFGPRDQQSDTLENSENASTQPDEMPSSRNHAEPSRSLLTSEDTQQNQTAKPEAGGQPLHSGRARVLQDSPSSAHDERFDGVLPPPHSNNISVLDSHRDQQASTLPYFTLFALLTLFFSLATAIHYTHPEKLENFIKNIPLVGTAIVKNDHLKDGVALQSIRGSYEAIQGNREVFLVTGRAMNQNSVVIREVQIAAETFSADEKSLEQQSMWIGNAISPKIIRGMTAQDIADLQRLKPLKTFEIPPGDSVPFTIVFLKPAKAVKDFTCAVVSAEEEV